MEFSLGRAAQKSPVRIYHTLTPEKKGWRYHGYMALAGNVLLMMFYTSVTGWMLQYFFYMVTGRFEGAGTPEAVKDIYNGMLSEPLVLILFLFIVVALGFTVCSFNMQKGLERVTKWMMLALYGIMIFLAINSLTLPGAKEGLSFYLVPSIERLLDPAHNGILGVIVAAMNQAFFTLSLGIGSMAIFGSFIGKERSLLGEGINVALLDTSVAVMSGLIIFPACYSYGVTVTAGPSLIFEALPLVFNNMWGGRVFGSLFFLFMSFAALSTIFAVFQNILSCTQDLFGWGKKKACLIDGIVMFALSVPCILGFNLWDGLVKLGSLSSVLDLEDYVVSNVILPLGALTFVLYCTTRRGWGWENFTAEANAGKGLKVKKWMYGYMKFVLPVIIGAILVIGVLSPFI
jgi:NSS family neurotransmitter:Na+ symporter